MSEYPFSLEPQAQNPVPQTPSAVTCTDFGGITGATCMIQGYVEKRNLKLPSPVGQNPKDCEPSHVAHKVYSPHLGNTRPKLVLERFFSFGLLICRSYLTSLQKCKAYTAFGIWRVEVWQHFRVVYERRNGGEMVAHTSLNPYDTFLHLFLTILNLKP